MEQRKEGRESLDVSLQARDQSKRVSLKEASIWSLSYPNPQKSSDSVPSSEIIIYKHIIDILFLQPVGFGGVAFGR